MNHGLNPLSSVGLVRAKRLRTGVMTLVKVLRFNLTDRSCRHEELASQYAGLGGRGFTARLLNEEVPADCDPFGPANKLVVASGILTGTALVNSSRLSIGGKSPLTGGIKESNVGGRFGLALAQSGLAALVIEGALPSGELGVLHISREGQASILDGAAYKGMRTYALAERLLCSHGAKSAVLCIGPAGEQKALISSIQSVDTSGRPCRAAGRGGLAAVMGAKGIKAIVVEDGGHWAPLPADLKKFKQAAKDFAAAVKALPFSGTVLRKYGTAALMDVVNLMGAFPAYNATRGVLENHKKINGAALADIIAKRGGKTSHMGCPRCIIHCSNDYYDENSEFVTASLEYESLWALGGMTGIVDLDVLAKLDRLCDDIGLDTMSTGVAIAVSMDAGYRPFGDAEAALTMIEEIATSTEFGKILAQGPSAVGRHFGHDRVPVVKNQSIAAYDPRGMQGTAVTYATSPMGADHTAGNLLGSYMAGALDPLAPEGQLEASRNMQLMVAALDCTGLCLFVLGALNSPEGKTAFLRAMGAFSGGEYTWEDFMAMGAQVLKSERCFNTAAGLTKADDHLPRFFYEEPLPPHNKVMLIGDAEMEKVLDF